MATTVIKTDGTSIKIYKPSHVYLQPLDGTGSLTTSIYDLDNVLKDSTKLPQADDTKTTIESDTTDTPIKVITKLGERTFECTVEDMQDDLLTKFCGFTASADGSTMFAPSQYEELYCQVTVVCDYGSKHFAYVYPKLQLSTKTLAESLSSNMAGIQITGTAMNKSVTVGGSTVVCPLYTIKDFTLPITEP